MCIFFEVWMPERVEMLLLPYLLHQHLYLDRFCLFNQHFDLFFFFF